MQKSILLIGLVSLAVFFTYSISKEKNSQTAKGDVRWAEWKEKYGKSFSSEEEDIYRFSVFLKTLAHVQHHKTLNKSFTIGVNKFAAMTNEEYQALYFSGPAAKPILKQSARMRRENLPNKQQNFDFQLTQGNVNWVTAGMVPPVRDMGSCQASYAFASVSNIESLFLIAASTSEDLSVEQVVQCSSSYGTQGCNGGTILDAYNYISAPNKLCTDNQYPYNSMNGVTGACNTAMAAQGNYGCQGYDSIPADCSYVLNNLQNTPITAQIVPGFEFQYYTGGVFSASECPGGQATYSMVIVGVNSPNYWIMQNSQGTDWGIQGYMWLQYGDSCQVCTNALQPNFS